MTSKMKKLTTGLMSRTRSNPSVPVLNSNTAPDSPEAHAANAVRLFCESGSSEPGGEEVLHLPVIVEAAESSPVAAAAAARQIHNYLRRDWGNRPHVQYNAIMLTRILSDNPGPTFTRNFDKAYVSTAKDLLRGCKDAGTQQIMRETLDAFEVNKSHQEGMGPLLQMWQKEKGAQGNLSQSNSRQGSARPSRQGTGLSGMSGGQRAHSRHQLPPPHELASRIEEARNTAKILLQLVQSTSAEDLQHNELVREFSERCQSAQRSMQTYINCNSPPPDDETMLTLIETNEQLSLATTRHQRSVLAARKAAGQSPGPFANPELMDGNSAFASPPPQGGQQGGSSAFAPPPGPPNHANGSGSAFASPQETYQTPPGPPLHYSTSQPNYNNQYNTQQQPSHNPFADPNDHDQPTSAFDTSNQSQYSTQPYQYSQPHNYSPDPHPRPTTADYSNAYSPDTAPPPQPPRPANTSTDASSAHDSSNAYISPISPVSPQARPGPGPYRTSAVTPSYMGRQSSSAEGVTMHGAAVNFDARNSTVEGGQGYGQGQGTLIEMEGEGVGERRDEGAGAHGALAQR